ncbi:hypothetical protein IMZ48_39440 [Candidatus Bathyarchaeota archaeon]|nr:hypothetical protein [Candidatus Bathyarchaeota archaeon]
MSTALASTTPSRNLSLARRIPLPATPADVASAVDRGTTAVRTRMRSIYADSHIEDATSSARDKLSTIPGILLTVAAFELYHLKNELITNVYAFTVPALPPLTRTDYPVHVPDMFLLLTGSFWKPVLLWLVTSLFVPAAVGYFYNLSSGRVPRRGRRSGPEYTVDPLAFSVAKALISFVVYAQGVSLFGLVDKSSIGRINGAVYGGWRGVLVGCAVTGLTSLYDAILTK